MADIKIRDVTRGSIKTLDRAASSMHHLKEETIKGKYMEPGRGQDDHSGETYAENRAEQYAGDSAAYASKAGIDMLLRSREHSNGYPAEIQNRLQHLMPVLAVRNRSREHLGSRVLRTSLKDETDPGWLIKKWQGLLKKTISQAGYVMLR